MARKEEFNFDFDIDETKAPGIRSPQPLENKETVSSHRINMGSFSLDLSQYTLIIRVRNSNKKGKMLIYLDDIHSTVVCKYSNAMLFFLAILFLMLGIGGAVPTYIFYGLYALIVLGAGLLLFTIFFTVYMRTKSLYFIVNYSENKVFRRKISSTRDFASLNDFFDELYYRRRCLHLNK